jgi:hypothetical protein
MIWFYQRGDQHLFYEVRLRDDGPGYELGLASPEGTLLTERFVSEETLSRRSAELQAALLREGWGPADRRVRESTLERRSTARYIASGKAMVC